MATWNISVTREKRPVSPLIAVFRFLGMVVGEGAVDADTVAALQQVVMPLIIDADDASSGLGGRDGKVDSTVFQRSMISASSGLASKSGGRSGGA